MELRVFRAGLMAMMLGLSLGCSGLAEGLVELVSGVKIESQDDGSIVITDPDGKRQIVQQGAGAVVPDGFPLPLPPGNEQLESTLIEEGGGSVVLTYKLADDTDVDAVITYYESWFGERGMKVERTDQNMAGMRTAVLLASDTGVVQTVTIAEALGSRTLVLSSESSTTVDPGPARE